MDKDQIRKAVRRALALALLVVVSVASWKFVTGNFATVAPGCIYRAAQMDSHELRRVVHEKKIKTVLNLRGSHPEQSWYRAERAAVLAEGATLIDVAMSSCDWMSRAQLRAVIDVLDTCERPMLIHCWRGAERTGLVSAFTELLRPGGSLATARGQFSIWYLFVPVGDGAAIPHHLDGYEVWLHERGLEHSPALFRRWVAEGFRPGKPSREDWPYDPYPLVVVTRPNGASRQ